MVVKKEYKKMSSMEEEIAKEALNNDESIIINPVKDDLASLLSIYSKQNEYIMKTDSYGSRDLLMFSVNEHDNEFMELFGIFKSGLKNVNAENIERVAELSRDLSKALVVNESEKRNPLLKIFKRSERD